MNDDLDLLKSLASRESVFPNTISICTKPSYHLHTPRQSLCRHVHQKWFYPKYNEYIRRNKELKYFVSFSHFQQDGMFQTDVNEIKTPDYSEADRTVSAVGEVLTQPDYDAEYYFTRTTARSNIDISLNDDFTLSVDLSYTIFVKQKPSGGLRWADFQFREYAPFGMFYRCSPQSYLIVNPDGSMANDGLWRQNLSNTGLLGIAQTITVRWNPPSALNINRESY